MISKLFLMEIIQDQLKSISKKKWIERAVELPAESGRILIVSGVRRCGKRILLQQKLLQSDTVLFINFEDPRLIDFTLEDFSQVEKIAEETGKAILMFDEVQNIRQWELYARMANEKGISLYITGSNASMLRRETREIFYYKNLDSECDFLVKQNEQIVMAVQSCREVNNENMAREVNGIKNAMLETGATEGLIITHNQEDKLDGIELIPAWKWI